MEAVNEILGVNRTWKLVPKPKDQKLVQCKWLFKLKEGITDKDPLRMETIPYANVIGSLMDAMISTRPDLSFVISLPSRFMSNPGMEHWTALKWVLQYVSGSLNVGLEYYKRSASLELDGFVDSDFAGDRDTRKLTTAYYFTLGGNCIAGSSITAYSCTVHNRG
ncbi:secreted RxLR effector protein 161-like [Pistacia vera]|uniref:secreted RxLR effector protein 161-like n=1 Tax=Pistacia vera TaxID=55513 RepID=UPI00126345E8|nr:secreted RxLR effector protein 161-like [Pistacia vera]